ncbi:MAG: hypothetical protein JST00_31965 [Deltaproteobacteria bacterium]|nr:hypothetical protein [Deltaproteobacteria bacterium]
MNDPNAAADPVAHAARFIAIFAAIPAILGLVIAALPMVGTDTPMAVKLGGPITVVVVLLAVAFGVHRRSIVAVYTGIAVFAFLLVGMVVGSLAGGKASPATILWALILVWPIRKLWSARSALERRGA